MNRYIFPNDKYTNQTTYYWFKNGFNDEDIQRVKDYIQKLEFEESTTFSGNDKSIRDSQIKWIDCNPETEWLYEKIYNYAKEANDSIFNFKLYFSKDSIQYSKYSENGKYDWHIDIGEGENNLRKLSCSILLNDPKDFEGGDLELFCGETFDSKKNIMELKRGYAVFFASFLIHRVMPIIKGNRKSLVMWFGGTPLK